MFKKSFLRLQARDAIAIVGVNLDRDLFSPLKEGVERAEIHMEVKQNSLKQVEMLNLFQSKLAD